MRNSIGNAKKTNVSIVDFSSKKVYKNNFIENLHIVDNKIALTINGKELRAAVPDFSVGKVNNYCIIHDSDRIAKVIKINEPTNTVKRVFWKYGFRNDMYLRNKNDIEILIKNNNIITVFESNHIIVCAEYKDGIVKRLSASHIWVDFKNITAIELYDAQDALNKSEMVPLHDNAYIFD